MGEHQNPCPPVQQESDSASPNVLGDFYIEEHHYLVICLENQFENPTERDLDFSLAHFAAHFANSESVVGQLKVDRQHCAIVEVEYGRSEDSNSDVTIFLTERELQIVQLVAKGNPNKQVAHRLHISEWTVSTHLRRIFAKLGVDSRAAMVYRCSSLLGSLE
jgi:DNA-binding CsgD family transcriptional regulator